MIGLDTNVLVRYLTRDDAAQASRARNLIAGRSAAGEHFAVTGVVLAEMVWVLREAYGYDRNSIAAALDMLLDFDAFVIDEKDVVRRALAEYRRGRGDFADWLIGWSNREDGCSHTATFDRQLKGSDLFRLL